MRLKNVLLLSSKLAEFNFKILNNISSCEANLYKWKLSTTDKCIYCKCVHTIRHMLFECPNINSIWVLISQILKFPCTYRTIVLSDNLKDINIVCLITIVCYVIHTKWYKDRQNTEIIYNQNQFSLYIRNQILYHLQLYKLIPKFKDICKLLNRLSYI